MEVCARNQFFLRDFITKKIVSFLEDLTALPDFTDSTFKIFSSVRNDGFQGTPQESLIKEIHGKKNRKGGIHGGVYGRINRRVAEQQPATSAKVDLRPARKILRVDREYVIMPKYENSDCRDDSLWTFNQSPSCERTFVQKETESS